MDDQTLIATPPEPKSNRPSSPEPESNMPPSTEPNSNMSSPQAPKSNRNLIIGIVAAVVLCCCCVVTAIAAYYGYQAYVTAQEAVQQIQEIEIPTGIPTGFPFDPNQLPEGAGDVPEGGQADAATRYNAWLAVQLVGLITSCETPTAQDTTIEVTQQPDASGVWVEQWNVNCGSGNTQPFKVTFTPENGIVNVNVEIP